MSAAWTCQFEGCRAKALLEPAGRGIVNDSEVDLYLCRDHRDALRRGAMAHVALSVKSTPARPA